MANWQSCLRLRFLAKDEPPSRTASYRWSRWKREMLLTWKERGGSFKLEHVGCWRASAFRNGAGGGKWEDSFSSPSLSLSTNVGLSKEESVLLLVTHKEVQFANEFRVNASWWGRNLFVSRVQLKYIPNWQERERERERECILWTVISFITFQLCENPY